MSKEYKTNVISAKKDFYKKQISELMSRNTSKWYMSLKKITSYDQHKSDKIVIQEINHLSDKEQAEKLGEHFSTIPNQYDQLSKDDIKIEPIEKNEIPQLKEVQVWDLLTHLKTNKSTVQGDLPG